MNKYSSKEEEKAAQNELRKQQQKKDGGKTFGNDDKAPCKKEQALSLKCLEFSRREDCQVYFDNYKNCLSFWSAVREFRARYKNKTDLPTEEERIVYKKQLRSWLETKKIIDPDLEKKLDV